jgi:hypothetical protein
MQSKSKAGHFGVTGTVALLPRVCGQRTFNYGRVFEGARSPSQSRNGLDVLLKSGKIAAQSRSTNWKRPIIPAGKHVLKALSWTFARANYAARERKPSSFLNSRFESWPCFWSGLGML